MTTEIKIQIPEGYVVEKFDEKSGTIKIKPAPKAITDRIKNVDDAIDLLGDGDVDVLFYKNLLTAISDRNSHIIKQQEMVIIIKALNEGWVPNWGNPNEYKYIPWFEMNGSSGFRFTDFVAWYSRSYVGSRLCFKTRALAEYAGKTFTSTYEQFMTIK